MRRTMRIVLVAAAAGLLAMGCAGDIGKQVMGNPDLQAKIMDMISADSVSAGSMVDRLLGHENTRAMIIEKLVSSAGGAQAVMDVVAKNQTLMDGALNVAMQDPAMKEHVMTLFKGMSMTMKK